ncbi:MAG: methyl-accepting chemotaxis protein [Bacteriovoracaceae bacterium]
MKEGLKQKIIWQTSIRLILGFIIASFFILSFVGVFSFHYLKNSYDLKIKKAYETVTPSLTEFLWNTDMDNAEKLIESLLKNEYILHIKLIPEAGEPINKSKKVEKSFFSFFNKVRSFKQEIIYTSNNEKLGTIYITTGNIVIINNLLKFSKVIAVVSVFCLLIFYFIVFFLLKILISHPLEALTAQIKSIQDTSIDEVKIAYPYKNEISKLVETINRLLIKEKESKINAQSYLEDVEKKSKALEDSEKILQNNFEDRIIELERIKEISSNAKKEADKGKLLVDNGREIVQKLVFNMRRLEKANRKLNDLKEMIYGISTKTRKINNIVSESRLLSFNAEIEAAQAGKFGKGFSVVASEMGNLAQTSGEIANEIGKIINYGLKDVDDYFKRSSENIKSAKDSTGECLTSFKEVEGSLEKIFVLIDEIAKDRSF